MRGKIDSREAVLLCALLMFVVGLCLQPMSESDLFFRLKVGQEILSRKGLLGRNLFSFTAPDHRDLDLAWAFEVGVALLYRAGGFKAVVIGKTIGIAVVFVAAFAICRRRGAGPIAAAIVLGLAALVMRERFVERPHIVSFAGEVVVLAAVARLGSPWTKRGVVVFALAMVVWANAHAGLFAGVLILALAGLGALATDRAMARRAFALGAIVVGAAFATPVGPRGLVRYLTLHLRLPGLHPVDEFRTATWRSDAPFFVWLAGVAVAVVATVFLCRRYAPKIPGAAPSSFTTGIHDLLPELLPGLGMTILGIASVRFSADAVLVTAPLLATRSSVLFRIVRSTAGLGPAGPGPVGLGSAGLGAAGPATRLERAAALATAFALLLTAAWPRLADARAGRPVLDLGVDSSQLPLDALRFVEQNGLRERMYNDFEIGSYLIFEGYPRYRVFVDPRLPAYPEDMHRLLGSFDLDRATWDAAMTRYGVESALLGYAGVNRRVAWWDPQTWALVYRAADARVFVRRRERWRALIAAHEIPATFDFTVENGTTTWPIDTRPALSPVSDCEWQRRLGDLLFDLDHAVFGRAGPHYERALEVPGCLAPKDEAKLAAWLGAVDLADQRFDRAAGRLGRALTLLPDDTRTREPSDGIRGRRPTRRSRGRLGSRGRPGPRHAARRGGQRARAAPRRQSRPLGMSRATEGQPGQSQGRGTRGRTAPRRIVFRLFSRRQHAFGVLSAEVDGGGHGPRRGSVRFPRRARGLYERHRLPRHAVWRAGVRLVQRRSGPHVRCRGSPRPSARPGRLVHERRRLQVQGNGSDLRGRLLHVHGSPGWRRREQWRRCDRCGRIGVRDGRCGAGK